ncbi:Zn(II)2Cys6 transcription factor [Aspergillus undulatus]
MSKLGCDKSRPQCMRCLRRERDCHYAAKAKRARVTRSQDLIVSRDSRTDYAKKGSEPNGPLTFSESRKRTSDGEGVSSSTAVTTQKRNRIPKACFRCRQLKVKCDRQQPCGRCLKGDGGKDCRYPTIPAIGHGDPQQDKTVPVWKQRFHTRLHWSGVLENIESLLKYRRWSEDHVKPPEQGNTLSTVDNIFGNIGPLHNAPRRTLLSYVPPREVAESYIEQYLDVIEPSHQILEIDRFKEEVGTFWDRPSTVDDGWLAQFFVILALGSQLHKSVSTNSDDDIGITPARFFEAAQVCLQRTPFMIRPQITSIRTMCLFVIFKQARGMSCIECDALWPATGLIVRLAIMLGLHLSDKAQSDSGMINSRNKLWGAVILLDLRQSLAAGMPIIPPSRDLLVEPLFNIDQVSPEPASNRQAFGFPLIIYNVLPQIFKILELATCPQITLSYDLVAKYDRQIRNLLKQHQASMSSENNGIEGQTQRSRFQWTMSNVFFRRVLLALHSRLYQEPQASTRYPVSYWSSLECSIALLSEQRELWDSSSSPASSPSSAGTEASTARFFARLFQAEFFLAAVTICFHLVQDASPLVLPGSQGQGQARRTILDLLESCREIWGWDKDASICHSRSFDLINYLMEILEADVVDGDEDERYFPESGCTPTSEMVPRSGLGLWGHGEWGDVFCLGSWAYSSYTG